MQEYLLIGTDPCRVDVFRRNECGKFERVDQTGAPERLLDRLALCLPRAGWFDGRDEA